MDRPKKLSSKNQNVPAMGEVLQVQWSKAGGDPHSLIGLYQYLEDGSTISFQRSLSLASHFIYLIFGPAGKNMPSFLKDGDQLLRIGSLSMDSLDNRYGGFIKNKIKEELEKKDLVTLLIRRRPFKDVVKYLPWLMSRNTMNNK